MNKLFLLFSGMYMFGLLVRFIYEQLKKTGKVKTENKIIFLVVFVSMCMLWVGWFNMCTVDPILMGMPTVVRWIGFGLFIVGLCLAIGAVIQLRGLENIDHLVTNGLFSKIRHPMYLGFFFWLLGWPVYHGAAVSMSAALIGMVSVLYWRKLEEKNLENRFGEDFIQYRRQTWF